ncbi:MAG: shikimate dehydrogenase [Alphaproteobacteria bacterium]|nr:shikimate dehydrogenase [Alphaproteobacteria bacterium]
MILTGKAKIAGIFGWPIAHSRSPRLHGFWLERHGIDGVYVPLAVVPEKFAAAFRALPALGFRGINVTVPHKEAALAACDEVDAQARRIGAVNTVVVDPSGRLIGSNTDAFGFIENLRRSARWDAGSGPAVLLGAGGAARAIAVALIDAGAPEVRIANRTRSRAQSLAAALGAKAVAVDWDARAAALADAALLVNSTTLGMQGHGPLDLDLARLPAGAVVTDIVYTPLQTKLLRDAAARGNPTVDGLGMLLYQAQPGFEQWFGVRPEVDEALRRFVLDDLG